jgi:hypothetical protein
VIDPHPPRRDPALSTDEDTRFTWLDWVMMAVALTGLAMILLTEDRP